MANTLQSEKRARQSRNRRLRGQAARSRCRTMIKKARAAAGGEDARAAFTAMQSALDRAAGKKILSANAVARIKRRTSKFLRDAAPQAKPAATKAPAAAKSAAKPEPAKAEKPAESSSAS